MKIKLYGQAFYRYLFTLFIILLITVILLLPVYRLALDSAYESSTATIRYNMESAVAQLENNMLALLNLDSQLRDLSASRVKRGGSENEASFVYNLIQCQRQFSNLTSSLSPAIQFMWLFSTNAAVITAGEMVGTIYPSCESCFDNFMRFSRWGSKELCSQIMLDDAPAVRLLPQSAIYLNGTSLGECITAVVRVRNSPSVFCAVYPCDALQKLFRVDQISPGARLSYALDGEVLFDTGAGSKRETVISLQSSVLGGVFQVGVPDAYFSQQVASVKRFIFICLIIALSLGSACAVLFAIYNYRPMYRLMRLAVTSDEERQADGPQDIGVPRNEYSYLTELNLRYQNKRRELTDQLASMRQSMRSSHIERLLSDNAPVRNEREIIDRYIPELKSPCRLAILDIGYDRSESEAEDMILTMLPVFEKHGLHMTYFGYGQIYTVFADDTLIAFERAFDETNGLLSRSIGAKACATISSTFTGVEGLRDAFRRVQITAITSIHSLAYVQEGAREGGQPVMPDIESLQQFISDGDGNTAERYVITSLSALLTSGGTYADVVRLYETLKSRLITLDPEVSFSGSLIDFMGGVPILEQFEELAQVASALSKKQESAKYLPTYKTEMLKYIDENYTDSNLYAGSIALEFNISTKQVYKVVRELTGEGYSDYLEKLRIRRAAELLDGTSESVNNIAIQCGFSSVSTFYRSFKRIMDTSPTSYRSNHSSSQRPS